MSMSYAHGPSDVPLLGETIGENLRRTVERFGDREALVVAPPGLPRDLPRAVGRRSTARPAALLARGVRKGDRVGIWAPNRYEWVVIQYATARIGAILVNINPAYQTGRAASTRSTQAGVSLLVMAARLPRSRLRRDARRGPRALPAAARRDRARGRLGGAPRRRRATSATQQLAEREATLQFDDPINIQYTSGTTGAPKGATLTHHNILNNAYFDGRALRYTRARPRLRARCRSTTASGWCSATSRCTDARRLHGRAGRGVRRRAPCWRRSQAERCTSLYGVPTMFIAELDAPAIRATSISRRLRTGIMGGAPCPVEVMQAGAIARCTWSEVTIVCGMTETSPVSTQTAPRRPAREAGRRRVGRVHPHVEIKIVDPATGAVVPRGTPGEQCTRGYSVMLGYWDDAGATARGDRRRRLDAHAATSR